MTDAIGIPRGLGRHIETFSKPRADVLEDFFVSLFRAELTYTGVIVFVKFAILALYWRIFGQSVSIKIPIIVLSIVVFLWGAAVVSPVQQHELPAGRFPFSMPGLFTY